MYVSTPQKELAPEEDQGILFSLVKTPQVANLDYLEQATQQLDKVFATVPEKDARLHHQRLRRRPHRPSPASCSSPGTSASARQKQVLQELQPKFVEHCRRRRCMAFSPPALPGSTGGAAGAVRHHAPRRLSRSSPTCSPRCSRRRAKSGLFIFTDVDLKFDTPQIEFKIDDDKANRLGINMHDIGTLAGDAARRQLRQSVQPLRPQLSGHPAGAARVPPRRRTGSTRYQVRTTNGELVPLSSGGDVSRRRCSPTR